MKDVDIDRCWYLTRFLLRENYDYFIVYIDDDVDDEYDDYKIKPFCIMLLQTCAYVKMYDDEPKWTHFRLTC